MTVAIQVWKDEDYDFWRVTLWTKMWEGVPDPDSTHVDPVESFSTFGEAKTYARSALKKIRKRGIDAAIFLEPFVPEPIYESGPRRCCFQAIVAKHKRRFISAAYV